MAPIPAQPGTNWADHPGIPTSEQRSHYAVGSRIPGSTRRANVVPAAQGPRPGGSDHTCQHPSAWGYSGVSGCSGQTITASRGPRLRGASRRGDPVGTAIRRGRERPGCRPGPARTCRVASATDQPLRHPGGRERRAPAHVVRGATRTRRTSNRFTRVPDEQRATPRAHRPGGGGRRPARRGAPPSGGTFRRTASPRSTTSWRTGRRHGRRLTRLGRTARRAAAPGDSGREVRRQTGRKGVTWHTAGGGAAGDRAGGGNRSTG